MVAIFLIYGLAFFVLGISIYLCPKEDSEYKLASDLGLISAFGILHGLNEWIDMLILVSDTAVGAVLMMVRAVTLPVSFVFLACFGAQIIAAHVENGKNNGVFRIRQNPPSRTLSGVGLSSWRTFVSEWFNSARAIFEGKKSRFRLVPAALFIAWMIIAGFSHQRFLYGDILARYLIGAPGIFMTSYALYLELAAFKKEDVPARIISNLKLAAWSFACYGFFAGIVVPEAGFFPASRLNYTAFFNLTGIPVQIFRALCACVITISLTRVLIIFDWEIKNRFRVILDELVDSRDRLARSEKLMNVGGMAAGIIHELRSPLTAIKGAVYYIKHKIGDEGPRPDDVNISRFLGVIEDEINASDKIINDLLGYLRMGKLSVVPSDVNAVIERALHLIEIPDNVKMDVMLKDHLDCAMIDGDQIRQVFLNIILNALQSMPQGGRLKIETCRKEMFVEAKFSDTGCGIEKENMDKVFEPLFTTRSKGMGLGLAVTKAIVDRHNGRIELKSEKGRGTTFVVKLPSVENTGSC